MKHLQPKEAWDHLQQRPDALLVDVRMEIESLYVGRPPVVVNVPCYEYPDLMPNAEKFPGRWRARPAERTSRCC